MECSICKKIQQPTKENKNPCVSCDICRNLMCAECSELSSSELRCMPLQKRTLKFNCKKCRNFELMEILQNTIGDKSKIIEDQELIIELLKEKINNFEKMQNNQTYANVIKNNQINSPFNLATTTTPTLIIKPPKDQHADKTKQEIINKVAPTKLKIGIKEFKQTKQGDIIIKCQTKEEIETLKNAVEKNLGREYTANFPKKRNPRVKVVGYTGKVNENEIENIIRKQNNWIEESDLMNVIYIKKILTKNTSTIFIECSPSFYHKAMKAGKIFMGWQRYPIYEDLSLPRCYNCQGYHHKSANCVKKKFVQIAQKNMKRSIV